MPRFFLHGRDQDRDYRDPEGTEFPDLAAAIAEARTAARGIMADELRHGPLTPGRCFHIADEAGRVLAWVAFDDCLYQHLERDRGAMAFGDALPNTSSQRRDGE